MGDILFTLFFVSRADLFRVSEMPWRNEVSLVSRFAVLSLMPYWVIRSSAVAELSPHHRGTCEFPLVPDGVNQHCWRFG